jgi:mono/diheme cytochrome c family protein
MEPLVEANTSQAAPAGLRPTAIAPVNVVEPIEAYTANLESGRQIYSSLCTTCHGPKGEGGHQGGVPLIDKELNIGHIMTTATFGRNTMPAFASAYTREQMQDVATYIMEEIMADAEE